MTVKIFRMDDCMWYAAESLEAAVAGYEADHDCLPPDDDANEVSDADMDRLQFVDEDGVTRRSFREELTRRVAAGDVFPQIFASTEY